MRLENNTFVLVSDAAKALLLQNHGDEHQMDLRVLQALSTENPPTREQGTDKPGRFFTPDSGRASTESTDWHEIGEDRFLDQVAEITLKTITGQTPNKLVIAADPRSLGKLRPRLADSGSVAIIAEINRDFVHQTIEDIETALARA